MDASGRTLSFQPDPLIGVMPTSAADTTPGWARSLSSRSRYTSGRRSLGYFAGLISMFTATMPSGRKPGCTSSSFCRLRTNSSAPTSSTSESATCAVTSARRNP